MKKIIKVCMVFCLILTAVVLSGCQKKTEIPFSDLYWDATAEKVLEVEGTPVEKSLSVYNGDLYSFNKEFLGYNGIVKYMFNENGQLASVAWTYASEDTDQVSKVYSIIQEREKKNNGKSEFSNTNETAYGNVWYCDDCTVIITRIDMEMGSALQYGYINRDFSLRSE